MVYKVSFALILYVVSAILDAYLGITALNPYRSLFLRIAAVATIIAIFVLLIKKCQTLKIFPLFLASLILSLATIATVGYNDLIIAGTGIKVAAVMLTVKPDLIEIEIVTEDEEKQQPQQKSN
jgi:fucose 4-O-acetylase-like acetyltransferase